MQSKRLPLAVVLIVFLTYLMSFGNGFHFDDSHTVVDNPMIRSLSNIPLFFRDGRTFSVHPQNQGWRPMVSTTLAIDYWLGGGLKPVAFHAMTFVCFALQLFAMGWLCYRLLMPYWQERAWPLAWATALIFGVHPVEAETINYVIQRADLFVTVGLTGSVALYAWFPTWRGRLVYLVPFFFGALSKPTALVFPFLIVLYGVLFEKLSFKAAFSASVPAFVATLFMGYMHKIMTPASFVFGGSAAPYRLIQPWVTLTYVVAFFWPMHLSADTDMEMAHGWGDPRVGMGFLFLAIWLALAIWTGRKGERWNTVSFGMWWFLLTLLPTALAPLAEATNDHRMFLPFVGLTLAVVSALYPLVRGWRQLGMAFAVVVLALAYGTTVRNAVWKTDESLWRDVTEKSPRNGRALMNYGLVFMARGQYPQSQALFDRALVLCPNYSNLEVNEGINLGAIGRDREAEQHFRRAMQLEPGSWTTASFFARWLFAHGREAEGRALLLQALKGYPTNHQMRETLAERYRLRGEWDKLQLFLAACLKDDPTDPTLLRLQQDALSKGAGEFAQAQAKARDQPTAENYLTLSFVCQRMGRMEDGLRAAQMAVKLRPNFALAWNDEAAALLEMGRWQEGLDAAVKAYALDPTLAIANNNANWARRELAKAKKPSDASTLPTP
jgi:tetratricopeptide (TPR) repeat protein